MNESKWFQVDLPAVAREGTALERQLARHILRLEAYQDTEGRPTRIYVNVDPMTKIIKASYTNRSDGQWWPTSIIEGNNE